MRFVPVHLILCLALTPATALAQAGCPAASGRDAEAGWTAYRGGDIQGAGDLFRAALARCPGDLYARTGLGYVALREGEAEAASGHFTAVLEQRPDDVDALVGLGLLAWRRGDRDEVRARFLRVQELAPGHPTAADYLRRVPEPPRPPQRPPLVLPDTLVYPSRAHGDRFEVRTPDGWEPFYIKGVNLGAALPGKHPSQFPDSATYARWIEAMAEMNANSVRVYTIHPPAFYEALREHNLRHPEAPLWLIHGVWTELPEEQGHDYLDPSFEDGFFEEMERVVDLIHGRADLPPRPGHSSGFYTADVSPWTLAYIIGREWEPYSSMAFDSAHADFRSFEGRFVAMEDGNPMEAWLAKTVERMVSYETDTYRQQRPVTYTNWPTLDPLHHPTESTRAEEVWLRTALGERVDLEPSDYDNDILGLDVTRMKASAAFPAGVFASFHVYPYYPDFMVLQPSYAGATSSFGTSHYFGYLRELKAAHPGLPVVISEYGLPASHGPAHLQPQGLHHGGLTEAEMAAGEVRLTRELAEAGMAGGILFAWIDEWFKKNWLSLRFEMPAERNRLWYNRLDAEQQHGVYAMEAVPPVEGTTLAERRRSWEEIPALYGGSGGTLRAAADAAYLWLLVETPGRAPGDRVHVGLDIVGREDGDRRWPGAEGPRLPMGVEFVVVDDGEEVRVLADPPVNPFRLAPVGEGTRARPGPAFDPASPPPGIFAGRVEQRYNFPFRSLANEDGVYDSLRVAPNRRRIGRDSTEYLAVGYERGLLPGGPTPDGFWERDGDVLEVRIPWLLVNVTDPSSRSVLTHTAASEVRGRTADGRVVLRSGVTVSPDSLRGDMTVQRVADIGLAVGLRRADGTWLSLPDGGQAEARFSWRTWEEDEVRWRERRRPAFDALRETFESLEDWAAEARPQDPGPLPTPSMQRRGEPPAPPDPPSPQPQEDPADEAWRAGDTGRALELYLARLEADPQDTQALHRAALLRAWGQSYDPSLELFDRLLALEPGNVEARLGRARVLAWKGDYPAALEALDRLLADDPSHVPALEARAQFQAWAGRFDASLSTYDQLLAIAPENAAARRQQAQTLAWASRFGASRAVYDSLLAANPGDVEARLGLAGVLSFSGDLSGAVREYEVVLEGEPEHLRALQGMGRALSWGAKLVEGEAVFRRAVRADPDDVASLVGLAQNLRWQGRNAAALEVLERAARLDASDSDVREQRRWVDVALGAQVRSSVVAEEDSDDNRMITTSVSGSWNPLPRLGVRADAYRRALEWNALSRWATGVTVSGSWQAEPGWTFGAGVGGSRTDGTGKDAFGAWSLSVGSPGRYPAVGSFSVTSSGLDVTALLADRGVRVTEVAAGGRWTPAPRWRLDGSLGTAGFQGSEANRRISAGLSASRRLAQVWTLGVGARGFTFEKDLADGYFDPDFYGIAEVTGRWLYEPRAWSLLVEVAPGVQQVRKSGDATGALRASARVVYRIRPGRELSLAAGYSSAGLQSFSTGAADYRYKALIVGGSWVF